MYSGKTTELMRVMERYQIAGLKVAIFKPSKDNRPKIIDSIQSHDGYGISQHGISPSDNLSKNCNLTKITIEMHAMHLPWKIFVKFL
jgi:thymidine kinase